MNITIPKIGGGTTVIPVPTTDNGSEFKAIVPIASLSGGTATTAVLTIVGTSEQTSKGARRVLVKVELPYASLQKCSCSDGSYQVDTAISGEPVSIHTVLTLPKQAVKDLNAADGTRDAVFERITVLKGIMGLLLNPKWEDISGLDNRTYNAIVSVDGTIAAGQGVRDSNNNGTSEATGVRVDTMDPFVRGAALLKPFLNEETYDGMNF